MKRLVIIYLLNIASLMGMESFSKTELEQLKKHSNPSVKQLIKQIEALEKRQTQLLNKRQKASSELQNLQNHAAQLLGTIPSYINEQIKDKQNTISHLDQVLLKNESTIDDLKNQLERTLDIAPKSSKEKSE